VQNYQAMTTEIIRLRLVMKFILKKKGWDNLAEICKIIILIENVHTVKNIYFKGLKKPVDLVISLLFR
jgi:hypothetical protein